MSKLSFEERLRQSKRIKLGAQVHEYGGLFKLVEQLVFTREEIEKRYEELRRQMVE